MASTVQSEIIKSYNASCPQRKTRRKTQNTWWNTEVNGLRREARRAHRKAIKSKLEKDWEAFRQAQTIFKKAVRKAKRDSWRLFTESMKSQSAIARLTKVMGRNETMQISNVLRPDGKFTESDGETIDCLLDILAPGSREVSCSKTADEPNKNTVSITDVEIVNSICSLEKMEKAINEFQPFKAPGPDGIYPVLLQKGWNSIKNIYQTIFLTCLKYSYVPKAWKEGSGIFIPKPGKENYHEVKSFRMITLTSFQLKWLERLILYHLNDDSNLQARLSAFQYGFRAGVSTETALHEFVRRIELSLAKKKTTLGIFLDIVGAFDNITHSGIADALRELGVSPFLIHWIENLLGHCTVQVELNGEKRKREVVKGNPQGGILSPFLWNCVLNSLLIDLHNRGFHVQAYADDVAILVTGTNMLWIKGRAQKALNIANNWAHNQELQFSSKKTEIVLFTNKRKPAFGTLCLNGHQLVISKEARLLGITLDSKLTWKPHITRIARKATAALLQCRQIVGKAWGLNPTNMRWIYTAMIRPVITYACTSWVGGLNKKYLVKKLARVQRLACLMISSAFPSTPTGALEMLLNIMPINEFILSEALKGSYRLSRVGLWSDVTIGSTGKTKSHVDVCNEAKENLSLLSMPSDLINKTKVFGKQYKCLILERKDAVQFESALEQSMIRCYTDGSKLNGRAGASFYIEYPSGSHSDQSFFHLGRYSTVFQAEVFAIAEVAKKLTMEKTLNEEIIILVDSQAAILAIQNNTVKSNTVLSCIKHLNKLGENNHVTVAWTPGHTGIHGNEKADTLAKSGSAFNCFGPEPFVPIPYASCRAAIKDWSVERWKTSWIERKDCMSTKENVEWASPQLTRRLLSLNRSRLNEVLQVLTGHCNLQKHRKTTGRDESPTCPKCNLEEETPNHHIGACTYYQALRRKVFGKEKTTIKAVVQKLNINLLAKYLQQAGRLAEYGQ